MKPDRLLSKRIAYFFFVSMGFLFFFFVQALQTLEKEGNILWTGGYVMKILGSGLVLGGILGSLVCFLIYRSAEAPRAGKAAEENGAAVKNYCAGKFELNGLTCFAGTFLFIIVSWLPGYLAYYPGICSYDTPIQTGQIVSGSFNDHHPIAHTLLLQGAMKLGETVFGNVNTGIAAYTFLQLAFLAGVFAWGISLLHKYKVKIYLQVMILLYAMLFPFHMYMSISTTKDTIFTAFVAMQLMAFCILLRRGENTLRIRGMDILLFFSTIGMILFRNNGKYAMLVLLAVLALTFCFGKKTRKLWGRLFLCLCLAFLAGNLLLSVLFRVTNAEQGDRREMLSMPIQQLSRCMLYHGDVGVLPEDDGSMNEEDKALINDFILDEGYKEYRPGISDPVKRHTNTYVVRYRLVDFVRTYLHLLGTYPGDFINAALAVNAGWLSPADTSHAIINQQTGESGLGYVQTRWVEGELKERGIYKDSKWVSLYEKMERWADSNAYLKLPVLKYIFVPGTWLWLCVLFTGYLLVHRRFRMCIPLALVAGYYGTLFLGPTVQLRYIYPVMAVLPFMALLCCGRGEVTANK